MGAETKYNWTDNPTESGVAVCDTDVLNDCLMHLKYENIGLNKITNCLLEVPQRIKYDLTDGVLTIKAGSVVIVPYGVEDLTAQYPVGTTFLNDNFKVADTQFADGKFFVWAELVGDKEVPTNTTTDTYERTFCLVVDIDGYNLLANNGSGASAPTGSASGNMYYNTTTNLVERYNASTLVDTNVRTLPLMKIQANGSVYLGSINQVFNGMGYIGSTVWVDKGVKGLIPNGRNEDGTLKNIEFTTGALALQTYPTYTFNNYGLWYVANDSVGAVPIVTNELKSGHYSIFEEENVIKQPDGSQLVGLYLGYVSYSSGTVSNFNPKLPFHAPDIQDVVRKTGDTMSGTLELYGTSSHLGLFGGSIFTHNMNISMDTAPSSNIYFSVVEHQDKNNTRKSRVESFFKADGSHGIQLSEKHGSNYSAVTTGFDANGKAYTYAPHCDITNGIMTQAGIKKALTGYCKFGNGLVIIWGAFTPVSKGSGTVTFPTPCSNYGLVMTQNGTAPTDDYANAITVKARSDTGFTYQTGHAETPQYRYICIGYI